MVAETITKELNEILNHIRYIESLVKHYNLDAIGFRQDLKDLKRQAELTENGWAHS